MILNKDLEDLHINSSQILSEACRDWQVLQRNNFEDHSYFLSDLELQHTVDNFRYIMIEMREYIYIYENPQIRAYKKRPPKPDMTKTHRYLEEAKDFVEEMFWIAAKRIKKLKPSLDDKSINLGVVRDYYEFFDEETFELPLDSPEVIYRRYKSKIDKFNHSMNVIQRDLGIFKNQVAVMNAEMISELGVSGIRALWRDSRVLIERIHIGFIGVPKKEFEIFKSGFMEKITKHSAEDIKDEKVLREYIKTVNSFICEILKTPDYNGKKELEVALEHYVQEQKIQRKKQQAHLAKKKSG